VFLAHIYFSKCPEYSVFVCHVSSIHVCWEMWSDTYPSLSNYEHAVAVCYSNCLRQDMDRYRLCGFLLLDWRQTFQSESWYCIYPNIRLWLELLPPLYVKDFVLCIYTISHLFHVIEFFCWEWDLDVGGFNVQVHKWMVWNALDRQTHVNWACCWITQLNVIPFLLMSAEDGFMI
jgi:hypothetical protein